LYLCGVLSSLLFIATTVLGGALRPGFSHVRDTISELFSPGAPNKPLLDTLHTASAVLSTLFGFGVLRFVRESGHIGRMGVIGAVLIIVTGLVNIATATVFPQDAWGSPPTFAGEMHKVLAGVLALLSLASTLLVGLWLRQTDVLPRYGTCAIVSFTLTLLSGGYAITQVGTPLMGLSERITIAAGMLWTVLLSLGMYSSEI
jgi:hypothetical protein